MSSLYYTFAIHNECRNGLFLSEASARFAPAHRNLWAIPHLKPAVAGSLAHRSVVIIRYASDRCSSLAFLLSRLKHEQAASQILPRDTMM